MYKLDFYVFYLTQRHKIQLFEDKKVRTAWDDEREEWYFSIVDVCGVLTDSDYQTARKYWKVLKGRLIKEGNETVTNCYQLKFKAPDGKMRLTDVADTEKHGDRRNDVRWMMAEV